MLATSWLAPDSWKDHQEQAISEAAGASLDWGEYLLLVDRHRTPALSWAALKRVAGLEIPAPIQQALQKRSDACRMAAMRHVQLLGQVLKSFNREDIPVLCFKGPLLSFDLYGDIGLRQSKDVDLQVHAPDIPRAQRCLESLGYTTESTHHPITPRQWAYCRERDHQLEFLPSSVTGLIEIHWRNQWETPEQTSAQWERGTPTIWLGASIIAMDPVDRLLYLCSHGGEHAWSRAKWLGDIARIYAANRLDWDTILKAARSSHQERSLLVALWLLAEIYGFPLPTFSGNPWSDLPPTLIELPLAVLSNPEEQEVRSLSVRLRDGFRNVHYRRLLMPHRTWRARWHDLAFSREDFWQFHLPDSFLWAYPLMRPFLWLWRRIQVTFHW